MVFIALLFRSVWCHIFDKAFCSLGRVAVGLLLFATPVLAQPYSVQETILDGGGGTVTTEDFTLTSSFGAASPVGTVRTERYVLFSGGPFPSSGRFSITIIHDPTEGGDTAEEGQDLRVVARVVAPEGSLQSVTLHYRAGDVSTSTSISMTGDETGFVASIPGSALGETGFTYYFTATDETGDKVREPTEGVYSLPVALSAPGIRDPAGQPPGDTQTAYRLISVPLVLDDASPEAVLGDEVASLASSAAYDPSEARLFEPIGTRVAEYPRIEDFERGRAFWLIVRDGLDALDTGAGTVSGLDAPVEIGLRQGWNFVGTPFSISVPVANVRTKSGESVVFRSYGAEGYNSMDDPVTALDPFEGYALFVESATTLVVDPPVSAENPEHGAGKQLTNLHREGSLWHLRVRGTSPAGWDVDNVAAVHSDAGDGWDAHDWPEPPPIGGGLSVAFAGPDGAPDGVQLSTDVRKASSRGTTWPVVVTSDVVGAVTLSVDGLRRVPAHFQVWLVDTATKTTWDLRASPRARVHMLTANEERSLRLVVGTEAYLTATLREMEALPQTYALDVPYPNPSVGSVAVRFGIPHPERVTLEVYNVLGQRMAVLREEEMTTPGYHTIVWEPRRLTSGMYFLRMRAGAYRGTQKLVRVH